MALSRKKLRYAGLCLLLCVLVLGAIWYFVRTPNQNIEVRNIQVRSVAFGPGSEPLAIEYIPAPLFQEETIRIWDVSKGRIQTTLKASGNRHDGNVSCVAYSPDGKTLASVGAERILLWDLSTGKVSWSAVGGNRVAISPDGKTLASNEIKGVLLLDLATGQKLNTLKSSTNPYASCLAFSPDSKTLAAGNNSIQLWDVVNAKELLTLQGHTSGVWTIAFNPDGKSLASVGAGALGTPSEIKLWDLSTGKEQATLLGHSDLVFSLAYSPDGRTLASGSHDGTIKLWDIDTAQERKGLRGSGGIHWLAFSADGATLLSGSTDKTARLWDARVGP